MRGAHGIATDLSWLNFGSISSIGSATTYMPVGEPLSGWGEENVAFAYGLYHVIAARATWSFRQSIVTLQLSGEFNSSTPKVPGEA